MAIGDSPHFGKLTLIGWFPLFFYYRNLNMIISNYFAIIKNIYSKYATAKNSQIYNKNSLKYKR